MDTRHLALCEAEPRNDKDAMISIYVSSVQMVIEGKRSITEAHVAESRVILGDLEGVLCAQARAKEETSDS